MTHIAHNDPRHVDSDHPAAVLEAWINGDDMGGWTDANAADFRATVLDDLKVNAHANLIDENSLSILPAKATVVRLSEAGKLLYGDEWQTPLAREFEVDSRTVRYWVARDRAIPPHVIAALPELLRQAAVKGRQAAADMEQLADELTA